MLEKKYYPNYTSYKLNVPIKDIHFCINKKKFKKIIQKTKRKKNKNSIKSSLSFITSAFCLI